MIPRFSLPLTVLLGLSFWALCSVDLCHADDTTTLRCSADTEEPDPALVEIKYDVGLGEETRMVYVQPDVTSFYNVNENELPAHTPVVPKFNGMAAKFINMSPNSYDIYWESYEGHPHPTKMWNSPPFSTAGTASFPSHRFFLAHQNNPKAIVHRFIIGSESTDNIYVYDPFEVQGNPQATEQNLKVLDKNQREMYDILKRTILFNDVYKNVTGRSYLVNYARSPPHHYMWRADYFGQEHWVTTRETHFVKHLPSELSMPIKESGKARKLKIDQPRPLAEYRSDETFMNMTMKVISCAPRAFEIQNFLSETEVEHILDLAGQVKLSKSLVGVENDAHDEKNDLKVRTSKNSWVTREKSPVIDTIYRRAADLMRIDESLFRQRSPEESPDFVDNNHRTISESLQLVHYDVAQEYTAHHDFGYSHPKATKQPARFATLLLYLNEGMEGGETSFPRWVNAETFQALKVTPKIGKAVLFYSQLPDGNMDDLSQHAALPIVDGEKWLINLWVWDPIYGERS